MDLVFEKVVVEVSLKALPKGHVRRCPLYAVCEVYIRTYLQRPWIFAREVYLEEMIGGSLKYIETDADLDMNAAMHKFKLDGSETYLDYSVTVVRKIKALVSIDEELLLIFLLLALFSFSNVFSNKSPNRQVIEEEFIPIVVLNSITKFFHAALIHLIFTNQLFWNVLFETEG